MRLLIIMALLASVLVVGIVATPEDSTFQPLPADRIQPLELTRGIVTIGTVSRLPSKDIAKYQAFADWLARHVTDWEHARGKVRFAPTMDEMSRMLRDGEIDLYFDSLHPSREVSERAGSVPFLRRWKDGTPVYHSVVFARADTDLHSLRDLSGERVVFEEVSSTSGYSLPRTLLERDDVTVVAEEDWDGAPDAARFVFSGADENTIHWVRDGRAAAGAIDDHTFARLDEESPGVFRVLGRSPEVPRQVVSHREGLSQRFVEAMRDALLTMHDDELGRDVLERFSGTTRFDTLDASDLDAIEATLGTEGVETRR